MAWIYCWWYTMLMNQNFEADKATLNEWNVLIFLLFYNDLDLNNQKILCLPSIFQSERKLGFWTTLSGSLFTCAISQNPVAALILWNTVQFSRTFVNIFCFFYIMIDKKRSNLKGGSHSTWLCSTELSNQGYNILLGQGRYTTQCTVCIIHQSYFGV